MWFFIWRIAPEVLILLAYQQPISPNLLNMNRILTLLGLVVLLTGTSVAQSLQTAGMAPERLNTLKQRTSMQQPEAVRTTACPADTLIYGFYKNPSNLISGVFYRDSGNIVSIAGQWYPAEQNVTVNGVEFLADVFTTTNYTVDVEVSLWNVGPDSLPVGTPLATASVTCDSGFVTRFANFSTPVDIAAGNGYAVTLFNPDQDTAVLFRSNRIAGGEGEGELNGIVGFRPGGGAPSFFKSTALTVGGNPYDVDLFIFPIVNYSINADFTGPTDCVPQGQAVQFMNTSSPITKSRYYNRFFAFTTWIDPNVSNETFLWVPLSGDTIITADDMVPYTYNDGASSYDVFLEAFQLSMTGTRGCFDDTTITFDSGTPATADFSEDADTSLTVAFTDASVNADSVRYAFGDPDNSTSSDPNPTFTYPGFGTYQVIQIAYNACGNDTAQFSITIEEPEPEPVGIAELPASQLRIFPNPSEGVFQVAVQATGEMTLRVYNLVGQEVLRQAATGEATLDLSAQRPGVYLLEGEVAGQRFARRLLVK